MTVCKKILLWFSGIVGLLMVLLIAISILAPVYLDSTAVKSKIQATVSEKLGGKVSYERIDLSLFPRPHVIIKQLHLAYPRTFRGTLQSLTIYPHLLPLLRRQLQFSRIRILEPDFKIILPAIVSESTPEIPSLEETKANVRSVLGYLQAISPGLVVEMDNGKFLFRRRHRDFLSLRYVTVHFNAPPGEMKLLVKAGTDKWGDFTLSGAYTYDEAQSEVRDLAVSLGHSSLTDFSAVLTWDQHPRLEIRSGRASLALQEIYQWLSSSESLAPFMKEMSSLKGHVSITSMRAEGLISNPEKWHLRLTGQARRIGIESPWIPAPLMFDSHFMVEDNLLDVTELSARIGSSSFSHVSARLVGRNNPEIEIRSGNAAINITEIFKWRTWHPALEQLLKGVDALAGNFTLTSLKLKGHLFRPEDWNISATGILDHIVFNSSFLPGQVGLVKGNFSFVPNKLSLALQEATILDSAVTGTAVVSGATNTVRGIDLTLKGKSGRKTLDWVFENLELPPALMIRTPVALADSHLVWQKTTGISFRGTAAVTNGPMFFVDLSQQGADFSVRRLTITDQETKASFTLNWHKQAADFSFSGLLAQSTLSRIFEQGTFGNGTMHGDIHALIRTDQPLRSRAKGTLAGNDIFIPWGMTIPTTVEKFTLQANDDVLTIDSADVTWGKNHYSMTGAATTSDEGIAFSMAVTADGIEIQAIQQALEQAGKKSKDQTVRSFPVPPIRGDLRADSSYVKFGRFTFAPAHAVITVDPDRVTMEFTDTKTCGISIPGSLLISREHIFFTFTPTATKEALGPTIDCLTNKDINITGDYELSSSIRAQGTGTEILSSLEGRVDFKARDGKIYHYPVLQKILSVLSVLEVFRGRTPELGGSGFPYHSMAVRGDIHKGKFTVERAYIGGQSLDIIAEGEIDLVKQKMDLVVLVAPFSTLNWVIRNTPILGKIMGGTLISIPVRVSGDLANPDVVFLSPTAVGTRILDIMENIIKLPVDIVAPMLPKEKEQEKKK
ncbi:MAG TPA: AsmA-like C-terminal domain-containing protein [Nitrospirota bacterium]|nr:AsmA-like C-terminal domain-containing protein [Nitrospirota bacterium]